MMNLALLIFIFVLFTQIIEWIGKSVLQAVAFSTYSSIFLSTLSKQQRALRKQVLSDKGELSKTSSQDEFAKWAKLKRKVDKGLAELEQINSKLTSARTSFSLKFSTLLWILTTGAQLVLVWWYRRQPVFYLPRNWVPRPIGWILSFPSAPSGSVSSAAWGTVCKRVLKTSEEVVKDLLAPSPVTGPVPVPVPNPGAGRTSGPGGAGGAKIEEIEHEKLD